MKNRTGNDYPLVLMIDNYDSFTYNLYQYILEIIPQVEVFRNDKITLKQVEALNPSFIVLSPGPKGPADAGICKDVIGYFGPKQDINILGVCLGYQCINEVFGGRTIRAPYVCHGKTSRVQHDGKGIFYGLPGTIEVARYHSLVVDEERLSQDLEISARTEDGIIMGLRHKVYPIEGVQFHPESFLTRYGKEMIRNFFDCHGGRK